MVLLKEDGCIWLWCRLRVCSSMSTHPPLNLLARTLHKVSFFSGPQHWENGPERPLYMYYVYCIVQYMYIHLYTFIYSYTYIYSETETWPGEGKRYAILLPTIIRPYTGVLAVPRNRIRSNMELFSYRSGSGEKSRIRPLIIFPHKNVMHF